MTDSYPIRKHPRLRDYDYATPGMYFITVCICHRLSLLGTFFDGNIVLTPAGEMAQEVWNALPQHYEGVGIDAFVIMPNHIHGIVVLHPSEREDRAVLSLSDVIHCFKSLTTARYRAGVRQNGWPPFPGTLWQKDYYEHVIRNERELDQIRQYIVENPLQWALDKENPDRVVPDVGKTAKP